MANYFSIEIKTWIWVFLLVIPELCLAKFNCPLYGLSFPKPPNVAQHAGAKAAAAALDDVFSKYIDNDNTTGSDHFSYAIQVFHTNESQPLWSHYWTAPNLKTMNTTGVTKVDANTVFRLGSLTKIYTALAFLATVGDGRWNDPITKYLPEIADIAKNAASTGSPLSTPDWDSITIGSLASQTSGLIRDYSLLGEITQDLPLKDLYTLGFPPIALEEIPPCGDIPTCNRKQLFAGLARLPPSFPSFMTPAYSDVGYTLLSYIAESITGKQYRQQIQDAVLTPLNLTHTFVSAPEDSLGIIPGNRYTTSWAFEMGDEAATGNMYASVGDMSTLGRAIMRSTLLKPAQTRRWLKPATFSSDPLSAVGMPWGVRRISVAKDANDTYQYVTTFNKIGSLGRYNSLIAIIPDLDIGFSVLAAGDVPPSLATNIADALAQTYLPTMMYISRDVANETFSGRYVMAGNSTLNSSLTIDVSDTKPGLGISQWLSNGTDMVFTSVIMSQNVTQDYWPKMQPSVRLYPTGLEEPRPGGGKRVAFKAVFEDLSLPSVSRPFSTDCASWVSLTGVVYGSKPLDKFVFNMDASGKVVSVENAALRVTLNKVA